MLYRANLIASLLTIWPDLANWIYFVDSLKKQYIDKSIFARWLDDDRQLVIHSDIHPDESIEGCMRGARSMATAQFDLVTDKTGAIDDL